MTEELHFGFGPPRMIEFLIVTFFARTWTKPWMSRPLMVWPALAYTWSPVTTVRCVPAGTPVLAGPGLPPGRGATVGRRVDGCGLDGRTLGLGPMLALGPALVGEAVDEVAPAVGVPVEEDAGPAADLACEPGGQPKARIAASRPARTAAVDASATVRRDVPRWPGARR